MFYIYPTLGSRPGGDDIQSFTNVGLVHTAVARALDVRDGSVVFVSVNGKYTFKYLKVKSDNLVL